MKSEPIVLIGGTTYIYRGRFEVPLAAAISHAVRSTHFLRVKDVKAAVTEGREAVKLGAVDPRTHLASRTCTCQPGKMKKQYKNSQRLSGKPKRIRDSGTRKSGATGTRSAEDR